MTKNQIKYLEALGKQQRADLLSPRAYERNGNYDIVEYCKYFAKLFDEPKKHYG